MKGKTLLLTGALALVIIACVLAAGCTSVTTTQQTASDDKILGAWTHTTDEDVAVIVMMEGGNGYYLGLAKETAPRLLKYAPLKWTRNPNGTITHVIEDRVEPIIMTYDATNDIFNDDHGYTLTRLEPVTGIWYNEGTMNGRNTKFSNIFKPDGTGVLGAELDNGTTIVIESTWKKNADGTYTTTYADGFTNTLKLDETKNILSSTTATKGTLAKKFADTYYYLSILGPWYNEMNKALAFFNADGTYSIYQNKEKIGEGTWDIPEFGKFALHVKVGADVAGQDRIWTYDRVKDTFTAQNGSVYVRPSGAVDDLTYKKFS